MSSFDEKNESQEKNLDKLKRLDDLFSNVGVGRPAKTGLPEDMQEKVKYASAWSDVLEEIEEKFRGGTYFFNYLSIMRSVSMTLDLWKQGKEMAQEENKFSGFTVAKMPGQFQDGENIWRAQASFAEPPYYYNSTVMVYFNSSRVIDMRCENWKCPRISDAKKITCAHKAAILYMLGERIWKENPGDPTDERASKLIWDAIQAGPKISGLDQEEEKEEKPKLEEEKIYLEPSLSLTESDRLALSFRYGNDKMYKIRNITDFVRAARTGGKLKAGKKEAFVDAKNIAEESMDLYHMMDDAVTQLENVRFYEPQQLYSPDIKIKNQLILTGKALDAFCHLIPREGVEVSTQDGVKMMRLRDAALPLFLNVEAVRSDMDLAGGIHIYGDVPVLIRGEKCSYYISSHHINRVSPEDIRHARPLLDAAENGHISLTIGPKYLSAFYYDTLPYLQGIADVEIEEGLFDEAKKPVRAHFSFDLDVTSKYFLCDAYVSYKDKKFSLMNRDDNSLGISEEHLWQMRNLAKEERVMSVIRSFFNLRSEKHFLCVNDEEHAFGILHDAVEALQTLGKVRCTEAFQSTKIRKNPKISVGVSVSSGLLDLSVTSSDITSAELIEILQSYDPKKKYHRLASGDFIETNSENIDTLYQMMQAMHLSPRKLVSGKMNLPIYRAFYLDSMLENREDFLTSKDREFRRLIREFHSFSEAEFEIPDQMKGILRNYQESGFRWLKTLGQYQFGGILADDMGLGKTVQMITLLEDMKKQYICQKSQQDEKNQRDLTPPHSIIIAPAALIFNWQAELARFAPDLSVLVVTGNQQERAQLLTQSDDYDVIVTSYDLLKRDIAEYEGKSFDVEVIDEAQNIKNSTTAAAKSVKLIDSKVRYALTGTPIENRLSELWSIFDYLMPGFLYKYQTFKKVFETPIVKHQDDDMSQQLKQMISPFILRRLKKDVLKDLPPKLEEVYFAGLSGEQQKLYDGEVTKLKTELGTTSKEDFSKKRFQILAELTKLRQICCDPSLCVDNYKGESAKRAACLQLIQDAVDGGHKILVFSQFTSMLDLLEKDVEAQGITYYDIRGNTPKQQRLELVNQFNEDDTNVFFISLKAGGTGLNLTGADIVIHYDPWWNVAAENQATDRAHRIGQKNTVSVYKLIMKQSVEEKILELQEKKKSLAEEVLSGEGVGSASITQEELLQILDAN